MQTRLLWIPVQNLWVQTQKTIHATSNWRYINDIIQTNVQKNFTLMRALYTIGIIILEYIWIVLIKYKKNNNNFNIQAR